MQSQETPFVGEQEVGTSTEQSTGEIGSPISNEAYNVISALQSKLEGLEAYRKYAKDGEVDFWKSLTQSDVTTVGLLVDELERIVKEGKLRMHAPGDTGH